MYSKGLEKFIAKEFDKGNCIVAFLDILGFEELVKSANSKSPQDREIIIGNIHSALRRALKNLETGENKYLKLIKYKIFSDCTCLSIPDFYLTNKEATTLCLFMTMVKGYNFFLMDEKIYLRGGVSFGYHYEDDYMIFSDGLIKAHNLENKKAVYPRTILDEEVIRRLKRLWIDQKETISDFGTEKVIITDKNGTSFINPFNIMQSSDKEIRGMYTKNELKGMDKKYNKKILDNVEEEIKKYNQILKDLKKSFNDRRACAVYLSKQDYCSNEIVGEDKEKIKEYIQKKRVLDKYLWLKDLIKWNMNPRRSKIKFEYLLK